MASDSGPGRSEMATSGPCLKPANARLKISVLLRSSSEIIIATSLPLPTRKGTSGDGITCDAVYARISSRSLAMKDPFPTERDGISDMTVRPLLSRSEAAPNTHSVEPSPEGVNF